MTKIETADDLKDLTSSESETLRIALGVLRSGTDYADFLDTWLHDYGFRVLSPNPPAELTRDLADNDTAVLLESYWVM